MTGLELLVARRSRRIRQRELAAVFGVSQVLFSYFENDHRQITPVWEQRFRQYFEALPQ